MEIIDNINKLLGDDLKSTITSDSKLKIAASCFSIYAYEALKKELSKIDSLEFVFTSPSFVPTDSLDNQLKEWVYNARIANIELNDKELQIAIKGDAKEEYPSIRKVMDILQDQKINSFSLVTGLRGKEK